MAAVQKELHDAKAAEGFRLTRRSISMARNGETTLESSVRGLGGMGSDDGGGEEHPFLKKVNMRNEVCDTAN